MARALDAVFDDWVKRARAVPIAEVVGRNRHRLRLSGNDATNEREGPCPACGGRDRFGVNARKNVFRCRQCKADGGDVIALVRLLDGCDFLRAVETLTGEPPPRGQGHGLTPAELAARQEARDADDAKRAAEAETYREREIGKLRRWWRRIHPRHVGPVAGSPVEAYLALRRLRLPERGLRYDPAAQLWASGKRDAALVHTGPAMVAVIRGPEGRFAGLHVTWIDLSQADGKAMVPELEPDPETGEFRMVPAKKMRGSAGAGRIELVSVDEPWHLVIGEGIETTLSMRDDLQDAGRDLSGVAFWSGLSLGNIGGPAADKLPHPSLRDRANRAVRIPGRTPDGQGIPIPDSVTRITLLRDGDSDPFLTDVSLDRASLRWAKPGREIRAADAPLGTDFNSLRRGAL